MGFVVVLVRVLVIAPACMGIGIGSSCGMGFSTNLKVRHPIGLAVSGQDRRLWTNFRDVPSLLALGP